VKIRLDYVSNSSSSSYVVSTPKTSPFDRNMPLCESELFSYRDLHCLDKSEIESGLRWHSGKVDGNAIKVETILCDEHMKPIAKNIDYYGIPNDVDDFISWLMGISFSHNIVNLVNVSHEFSISVAPSKDGDTNIDDAVIEQFLVRLGRTRDGERRPYKFEEWQ